jgi:peptide/nickel transport system substrate-binding protein
MRNLLTGLLALLAAFSLLLGGCGTKQVPSGGAGQPAGGSAAAELKLPGGDWGLPSPFAFYPRGPGYLHLSFIYDTLTWKDDKGVIPWLAEKWEMSPDAKTWTFTLRPDVRWQDGRPLTAKDVAFTFGYLKQHPVEWFNLEMIQEVKATDERTVVFTLKSPYVPFLQQVAGNVPIIPEHIWSGVQDPRKESRAELLVGSGPYRLLSYDKSQGAYSYAANENFFRGAPRIKKLLFVPTGDKVASLERGEVDFTDLPASLLAKYKADPKLKVFSIPAFWVLKLQFNVDREPFSNVKVRQAVAYALDREELVRRTVPGGLEGAKPASPGFLPPDSSWHDPEAAKLYLPDMEKASALLREAGIFDRDKDGVAEDEKGRKMQFTLFTPQDYTREAEAVKLMLKEAGIACEVKALDIKTLDGIISGGQYDLAINGHGGIGGDPAIVMGFGIARGGILTPGTPGDPAYRELAQKLLTTPDLEQRKAICRQMQQMYAQVLPCLPLYYPIWHYAYNPTVFDGWFFTAEGGISIGIPMPYNKLAFVGER